MRVTCSKNAFSLLIFELLLHVIRGIRLSGELLHHSLAYLQCADAFNFRRS